MADATSVREKSRAAAKVDNGVLSTGYSVLELMLNTETQITRGDIVRRVCAVAFIVAYLGVNAFFLARYAVGDVLPHPIAYFFTWDMFPGHYCESTRKVAVGRTEEGRFVQLVPGPLDQYREGTGGDLTRVDLDRTGRDFRRLAEHALQQSREIRSDEPIVHVYLFEKFWPNKFNLPDDLYQSYAGEPKPSRHSWRLLGEFDTPRME